MTMRAEASFGEEMSTVARASSISGAKSLISTMSSILTRTSTRCTIMVDTSSDQKKIARNFHGDMLNVGGVFSLVSIALY